MTATIESTAPATLDTPEPQAEQPAPVWESTAIVDSAALLRAVRTVKGAVANKTTLPVLNNVLLASPRPGALDVTATDLGVGITVHIEASVFEPFALTVPFRLFYDTLPKSGDVMLTIDERTRTLTMEEADGTLSKYKGISAEEYPVIPPRMDWPAVALLPNALIQRVVKEIAPFASTDNSRPQLAAVCVSLSDDGAVTFAAADGFRLGKLTGHTALYAPESVPGSYLIPARAFAELDTLADQGDSVWMYVSPSGSQVIFEAGSIEVTSRLIEGTYVDINRVIPTDWATRVVVDVDTLAAMLKKVGIFAKDAANIVRWDISAEGQLTLSGNAAEVGNRTAPVPVLDYQGYEGGQVALNGRFAQDILAPYKGKRVAVEIKTYQSPTVFRLVDDDCDFLAVVMPMYLPNGR